MGLWEKFHNDQSSHVLGWGLPGQSCNPSKRISATKQAPAQARRRFVRCPPARGLPQAPAPFQYLVGGAWPSLLMPRGETKTGMGHAQHASSWHRGLAAGTDPNITTRPSLSRDFLERPVPPSPSQLHCRRCCLLRRRRLWPLTEYRLALSMRDPGIRRTT